jgi:hypothetical protein
MHSLTFFILALSKSVLTINSNGDLGRYAIPALVILFIFEVSFCESEVSFFLMTNVPEGKVASAEEIP